MENSGQAGGRGGALTLTPGHRMIADQNLNPDPEDPDFETFV